MSAISTQSVKNITRNLSMCQSKCSTMSDITSGQDYLFLPILTVRTRSLANKGFSCVLL